MKKQNTQQEATASELKLSSSELNDVLHTLAKLNRFNKTTVLSRLKAYGIKHPNQIDPSCYQHILKHAKEIKLYIDNNYRSLDEFAEYVGIHILFIYAKYQHVSSSVFDLVEPWIDTAMYAGSPVTEKFIAAKFNKYSIHQLRERNNMFHTAAKQLRKLKVKPESPKTYNEGFR